MLNYDLEGLTRKLKRIAEINTKNEPRSLNERPHSWVYGKWTSIDHPRGVRNDISDPRDHHHCSLWESSKRKLERKKFVRLYDESAELNFHHTVHSTRSLTEPDGKVRRKLVAWITGINTSFLWINKSEWLNTISNTILRHVQCKGKKQRHQVGQGDQKSGTKCQLHTVRRGNVVENGRGTEVGSKSPKGF